MDNGRIEEIDWARIRSDFSCVDGQSYLDTASIGPGPSCVREAVDRVHEQWFGGRGNWRDWEEDGEHARRAFSRLLGADADGVSLQPAVSVAAAQVAERLTRSEDGSTNLVVGESEFRSNLYPWLVQSERKMEVRVVPFRQGRLDPEDLAGAIDGQTAIVALSSVQSSNGFRADLERVADLAEGVGARLFVDATQSAGALTLPIERIDFLVTAAYKWLLAPRGAAFLYVRPSLIEEMLPLCAGWRTPENPYAGYYGPPLELAPNAARFDVSLAWSVWSGARAALEYLEAIGVAHIEQRVIGLARRFVEGVHELGYRTSFADSERSQIVGIAIEDADGVASRLREANVIAAVRDGYLRTSFHFYNDESDVDRALEALGPAG